MCSHLITDLLAEGTVVFLYEIVFALMMVTVFSSLLCLMYLSLSNCLLVKHPLIRASLLKSTQQDCGCDASLSPENEVLIGKQKVTSSMMRGLTLTGADGEAKVLDTIMGKDMSVVIFLRHLG